jgi:hypothetical protein
VATCSKCGGEVSTDQQICAACGTPVAAPAFQPVQSAAPAFQPVQPAAQQAPPVYAAAPAAYAAPAPVKSGPSALKIILIIVAIIVGLGILGVGAMGYMVYRVAHSVHVSDNGNGNVSVNGFGLNANSADHLNSSDLGVDIYPGAEQAKGGMKMNIAGTSTVIGKFTTSDSKDAVVAFYKDKLGPDATDFDYSSGAILSQKKGDQESVAVTITAVDGKTQFSIQHTKKG